MDVKDFSVKITIKNNRILAAMKTLGIKTFAELALLSLSPPTRVGQLISFQLSPQAYGDWSELAYNVSSALHLEPEDLWPAHIKFLKSNKNVVILELDSEELSQISAPKETRIDYKELQEWIGHLDPQKQRLLQEHLMEGATLEELRFTAGSNNRAVSCERARQKIAKATRLLKYESRLKGRTFEDFVD